MFITLYNNIRIWNDLKPDFNQSDIYAKSRTEVDGMRVGENLNLQQSNNYIPIAIITYWIAIWSIEIMLRCRQYNALIIIYYVSR